MIKYKLGDATNPTEKGFKIIAHGCNDVGAWGAGFVLPLAKRYPQARKEYLKWSHGEYPNFKLGNFQTVKITNDLYVANMITQSGIYQLDWLIPFRYQSFAECLIKLNENVLLKYKVDYLVMPRIGCGLAKADWKLVSKIIDKSVTIPVVIYDDKVWENTEYDV